MSFFAFCEAAERFSPHSFIYAVDTWEGDIHAGHYSEEVYNKVASHWAAHHRIRASLVRSTFDEAAKYFEDSSVDILHIDGLHTYEAVTHDFETWLPKTKEESVILFHDINVREREFGVWLLWQKLQKDTRYTSLEVPNGHGLGILIKGTQMVEALKDANTLFPFLIAKGELLEKLSELREAKESSGAWRAEAQQATLEAKEAKESLEAWRAEAQQATLEAKQANLETQNCKDSLNQVLNSTSWRAMAPIRKVANAYKEAWRGLTKA